MTSNGINGIEQTSFNELTVFLLHNYSLIMSILPLVSQEHHYDEMEVLPTYFPTDFWHKLKPQK